MCKLVRSLSYTRETNITLCVNGTSKEKRKKEKKKVESEQPLKKTFFLNFLSE